MASGDRTASARVAAMRAGAVVSRVCRSIAERRLLASAHLAGPATSALLARLQTVFALGRGISSNEDSAPARALAFALPERESQRPHLRRGRDCVHWVGCFG